MEILRNYIINTSSPNIKNNQGIKKDCIHTEYRSLSGEPISFKSVNSVAKTTPFLKSTLNNIDELFTEYKKSLGEVPLKKVQQIADNISTDTGTDRREVLHTMQKLTRFSGIKSLLNISESMEKHNVFQIGDSRMAIQAIYSQVFEIPKITEPEMRSFVFDERGLHNSLFFLY